MVLAQRLIPVLERRIIAAERYDPDRADRIRSMLRSLQGGERPGQVLLQLQTYTKVKVNE